MFIHNSLTYNLRPDFCIHDDNIGPLITEIVHKKGKNIFINTHYKQPAEIYVMHCAIWYHFDNIKNVKNTHGEALL